MTETDLAPAPAVPPVDDRTGRFSTEEIKRRVGAMFGDPPAAESVPQHGDSATSTQSHR